MTLTCSTLASDPWFVPFVYGLALLIVAGVLIHTNLRPSKRYPQSVRDRS